MSAPRAYLFLALCTLFWAGNAVASKLAVGHISPMLLTLLRWVLAVAILIAIGYRQFLADFAAMKGKLFFIAVLGALGFAGFNLLFYTAANYTTAVNISIAQAGVPAVIFIANFILFRLRVSLLQVLGFVLSLFGVALTASRGDLATLLTLTVNRGDAFILIAITLYGLYAVALRFKPSVHWKSLMLVMSSAALVTTLPFAYAEYQGGSAIVPDLVGWLVVVYTAIFPAILAQAFFMAGVEIIGANRAGIFVNLVPVTGTLLSVLILREILAPYHFLALAFVICGIVLAEISGRRMHVGQSGVR